MAFPIPANGVHAPIRTRWQVITGAPCSGKTAVIQELARRGHRVVPEAARNYIDAKLAEGLSLAQIKADRLAFERQILYAKFRIEQTLPPGDLIFMDRAVPDSVAYFVFEGLDHGEPLRHSQKIRYHNIFFLERLKFEKDAVRAESEAGAERLDELLKKTYLTLNYRIIRVPVMNVARRVDLILAWVLACAVR